MSINRMEYTTIDVVREHATQRTIEYNEANPEKNNRRAIGYSLFSAEEARQIRTADGARAFGLYDTANVADRSHADAFDIVGGKGKEARSARAQLRGLLDAKLVHFE